MHESFSIDDADQPFFLNCALAQTYKQTDIQGVFITIL